MEEKELLHDVDTDTVDTQVAQSPQEDVKVHPSKEDNIAALREEKRKIQEEKERIEIQNRQYQLELMRIQQQQAGQPRRRVLKADDVAEGQDIHDLSQEIKELKLYKGRPDLDEIDYPKMGKRIDQEYPRMAAILGSIEDPMEKKAAVYDFIKELKLDASEDKKQKLDEMLSKTEGKSKTLASAREMSSNPLDQAYKYSGDLSLQDKKRLREETSKYAKY